MELIRTTPNLDSLAKALAAQERWKRLRQLIKGKAKDHRLLLCGPATAALCVLHAELATERKTTLRLLIPHAQTVEWIDNAQWYRLLPSMLSWDGEIEILVQTMDPQTHQHSRERATLLSRDEIRVRVFNGSLEELWESHSPTEFDLAIAFCPALRGSSPEASGAIPTVAPSLCRHSDIGPLVAHSVPVYLTSFTPLQELFHATVAKVHGVTMTPVLEVNPFALVSARSGEHWSHTISVIEAAEQSHVDEEDQALLTVTEQMVTHSHTSQSLEQPEAIGEVCVVGDDLEAIHAMDGIFVDVAGGRFISADGSRFESVAEADKEALASLIGEYDPDWDRCEKLVWACCVKSRVVHAGMRMAS